MKFSKRAQAYLLLLITTVIWGASLQIVKNSYDFTTPYRFLFFRFFVASVCTAPVLYYYIHKRPKLTKKIPTIVLLEILGVTLSLSLLYIGLAKTSSIEASLLTTTSPLFTVVGGIIFLKEKEERHELIGLILAFAGTILLALVPLINQLNSSVEVSLLGSLLIIIQNITTAIYFVLMKKQYKRVPTFFAASISFYVGMISFFLIASIDAGSVNSFLDLAIQDLDHWQVWFASGYMGILGSFIALTAILKAYSLIEVSEASLFSYLQPIVFIPLGVMWLKETIYPLQITALIIVITGVIIASKRQKKYRKRKKN